MAIFTSILTAGANNHASSSEEANQLTTDFISPGVTGTFTNTSGVAPMTGAFGMNATGTDKTVTVTLGKLYNQVTPSGQGSQVVGVKMTANQVLTVADNVTGSTRYDWVYMQTLASGNPSAANPSADGSGASLISVNRSTSNTTDTSGTIPAFGQLIGIITVPTGFATISNSQLADKRVAAGAPIPDGSVLNTKLAVNAPWTVYTPSWTASSTAPAIGNGTITGRYQQVGKTVTYRITMTFGSTTTFGVGQYSFSMPVTASSSYAVNDIIGQARLEQSVPYAGIIVFASTTTLAPYWFTTTGAGSGLSYNNVTNISPVTWVSGNTFRLSGTYEAA